MMKLRIMNIEPVIVNKEDDKKETMYMVTFVAMLKDKEVVEVLNYTEDHEIDTEDL